jgi:hypothetical protein
MNGHYDESVLQAHLDGVLSNAEAAAVRSHLEVCPLCAARDKRVMAFDRAMRMVPLERPDADIAARVLARIDRRGPVEWLDHMLEPRIITGATFALFGIAGLVNVLLLSQSGRADAGTGTGSGWGSSLDVIARGIASGPDALASWLTSFLPQVFSHGALQVSLAVVLLVPLFLCADHVMAKRRVPG